MKTFLLKTWLTMICLLVGAGTMWGADATFTFSSQGYSNAQVITSGTIDSYTSWSATKGGTNDPAYYNTGTGLRVYNGGTFTVTSTKTIASITLTFSATGYTFSTSNTTTPQTVTPNATSYSWDVSRTCRLQKVEVTYASGGGSNPTALSAPTNLSSSNVTTTGATLSWDAVSNASSYTIKIGDTEHTGVTTTTYSATGLTAGTQYIWTVKAVGDGTNYSTSAYAANANFTTEAEQGGGGEPSGDETTVSFDNLGYASWGKSESFSGSTYDELSQTKSDVVFDYTRGSGSTYANTTSIRFYKDNQLKFTAPNGYKITSIVWTGSSFKDDVTTDVETCTSTTSALSWSGNASSVTFTRPSSATSYATLSSVSVTIVADGGNTPDPEKTLIGIEASGTPAEFWKGDAFNQNGIIVTALWDDESETDVTSSCSFSGYDMSTAGEQTVTVTYQGETCTYKINVQTIANTQATAYTIDEAIAKYNAGKDLATKVYVKGTVSEITTAWSDQYNNITYAISADGQTTGTQFLLYRCVTNGAEAGDDVIAYGTLSIYSGAVQLAAGNEIVDIQKPAQKTITALAISGTPTKKEYYVGDAFETAGLVVTGTYSDGTEAPITEGVEWTIDPETLALGTTSVDVMASVGDVDSEVFTVNGLTVTKPDFETVTYNFSSFTSGTSVELTNLDGFVITLNGNGGTNPAWNTTASEARVYAKGSLTVKANNAIIKSIEYDYSINANSKGATPTIDGVEGTTNAGTWDAEKKTWTGADEEVTFSTSGTAGNIGFTKLIIKYVESTKIETSLAWSATEFEATIGAENVFPTLTTTPVDLAGVTYESSNTGVATIAADGTITLVKEGETTITANYAGNAEYASAIPASYTLTVVKAPFVPTVAADGYEAVDFAALYSSVTTNATVEDYEGTSFAMAFAKPDGSSTPTKYYNTGKAVRAYTGNTITITGAEDIKYVDIAWAGTNVDDEVSITGLGTTTAVVTFSQTCRFTKITVSYKGSNSTLVATDGENYYATFSSEKNVVFANATAYTVSVADGKLALTEVKRNKVPAGNAVLLESATANVDYYFVDGADALGDNMLVACTETGPCPTVSGTNYYYKLAYGDNTEKTKLGFWYGAEDGSNSFNVKAGGAVLVVPQAVAANLRGFSFGDVTTGINVVETTSHDVIFNLQGQRINRLQQGVNIVNGKKVLR